MCPVLAQSSPKSPWYLKEEALMLPLCLAIDPNIVVSAAFNPDRLQRTKLLLTITKPAGQYAPFPVLKEYMSVLMRPYFKVRRGELLLLLLQLIKNRCHIVSGTGRDRPPCAQSKA
jgi:hypothetical protein